MNSVSRQLAIALMVSLLTPLVVLAIVRTHPSAAPPGPSCFRLPIPSAQDDQYCIEPGSSAGLVPWSTLSQPASGTQLSLPSMSTGILLGYQHMVHRLRVRQAVLAYWSGVARDAHRHQHR